MQGFRYSVTVQPLEGGGVGGPEPEVFRVNNHDDLLKVVKAVREKGILGQDDAASLAIGFKLFMEVVLQHRKNPLFAPLMEPLRMFAGQLKAAGGGNDPAAGQ